MDRILKGILKYRQTFRKGMVEEFKRVADRPEVSFFSHNLIFTVYVLILRIDFFTKPKAVFFTCMDSRMLPTRFTQTKVGDMFIGTYKTI